MRSKTLQAWRDLVDRWNNHSLQSSLELTISRLIDHPEKGEPHARIIFATFCMILARIHERAYSSYNMTAKLYENQASKLFFIGERIPMFDDAVLKLFPKILRPDNNDRTGNYWGLTLRQAKTLFEFLDSKEGKDAFDELSIMHIEHIWMPQTK